MGMQINGRSIDSMRYNGRDAEEARLGGSTVWPEAGSGEAEPNPDEERSDQ
ncbi:MAG: hypothetical protein MJZ85_06585 [Bacteroidales bacterium]|nr:hypothetical protein [Bacteroidales bacterium]